MGWTLRHLRQRVQVLVAAFSRSSRWYRFGFSVLLGLGITVVCMTQVRAATTVLLQYGDLKLSVPLAELQVFTETGEPSAALQDFLQKTQEDPKLVRQWLTTSNSPRLGSVLPEDFVLYQINKTLGDPLGREELEPLRSALAKAYTNDQAFSVMEVLEQYPKPEVRLTLSSLQRAYTDIGLIMTRIEPVFNVARQLLPELVCDCAITASNVDQVLDPTLLSEMATLSGITKPSGIAKPGNLSPVGLSAVGSSIANRADQSDQSDALVVQPVSYTPLQQGDKLLLASSRSRTVNPSYADKRLVFAFGPIRPSISIGELTEFAATGKLSRGWRFYLNLANIDRENFRAALTRPVKINARFLDSTLNSLLGEFALYEIGQIVQTPSGRANIQALRSTMVLSALNDDHFSVLELLQNYPTQQVLVNGLRLARVGSRVSQLRGQGATNLASELEGWMLQVQASAAENVCDCPAGVGISPLLEAPLPEIAPTTTAQFLPAGWQPVPSHREDRGIIKVVWLTGTPYEMGFQHGQLLHDEIASIGTKVISAARFAAKGFALGRLASKRTYPDLIEECQGLVDATQDLGIDMDVCMVMAYADVYQEILGYTLPQELFWEGCNQMVAAGQATLDGRLYHGSSVDNGKPVPYVMNHPVLFIRQPNTGLPHVFVTYPGVVWPNSGMNVAGITLGLDTAHPHSPEELSLYGRSNVQIMGKILQTATSFEEARTLMENQPRVRANLIMISDGRSQQAGVFEFTGKSLEVRTMPDSGVLYMTNHFASPEMYEKQPLPPAPSSLSRFERFKQLLEPNQPSSYYGRITPEVVASVERDRVNPYTQVASPPDVFDDNASLGGNGSLRQAIYDPSGLRVWIAAGQAPVPENPFVCLPVGEFLGFPNATPCESPAM
jgi:hypothetical protein